MAQTWFSSSRNGIPLRERPTPRTRPIAPHNAEETMPLTAEGHTRDPSATVPKVKTVRMIRDDISGLTSGTRRPGCP